MTTSPPVRKARSWKRSVSPPALQVRRARGPSGGRRPGSTRPSATGGRSARRAGGRRRRWPRRGRRSATRPSRRSWASERRTASTGTAKPTPRPVARRGLDLGVDAEHAAAAVEQRAARVAAVDRRVGLDRPDGLEAGERLDRAVERRDDPDRERLLLAERAADGGDRAPRRAGPRSSRAAAGAGSGPSGSILSSATSANGSKPTTSAAHLVAVGEAHEDARGVADGGARRRCVTTWALVAISPSPLITKPEPRPAASRRRRRRPVARTVTTPGDSRS